MIDLLRGLFFGPAPIVWVQQTLGPGWASFFRFTSLPGISWGVIAAVGIALLLWGRKSAYSVIGVVVLEAVASTLLNQIVFLPRPDAEGIVRYEQLEISSFPSGHVLTAATIWGWLYASGRVSLPVSATVIGLVALARIYLGVHFLGDVVGGFLLACGIVWLFGRVWPAVEAWLARRGKLVLVALGAASVATAVATVTVLEANNPYAWNAVGVMAMAPPALAAEYAIRGRNEARSIPALLAAAAGFGLFLLVWFYLPEGATLPAAMVTGGATLWTWAAAPALAGRQTMAGR